MLIGNFAVTDCLNTWWPTCQYLLSSEICDEMVNYDVVDIFGTCFMTPINQISK